MRVVHGVSRASHWLVAATIVAMLASLLPGPAPIAARVEQAAAPFTLILSASGGVIAASPPGPTYAAGTVVTLTPTPAAGNMLIKWTLDGAPSGWASPKTITMDRDHRVDALFASRPSFSDVTTGDAAYEAIIQLAARGVIKGYPDGHFYPADMVQRAQIAAFLVRAMGWDAENPGGPAPFSDLGDVDPELARAIVILTARGIAKGYPDGTYNPTGEVTHAQAISLITRSMVQAGYWTQVTAAEDSGTIYPNIPAASPHRLDILTYVRYAGAIPDRPASQDWADWEGPGSRGWTARVLWQGLDSFFSSNRGASPTPSPSATPSPSGSPSASPSPLPGNNAPVATDDTYSTRVDTPVTVAAPGVLGNDSDPDGNPIMAMKVSDPASGTVTLSANGSFTYTPNGGFTGLDSFTYRVTDGTANSGIATVTIVVSPNDPAPTVAGTTPANGATGVALDANLTVTFSEAVAVTGNWFQIACATSGARAASDTVVSGGPTTFTINPNADFAIGESCTATIVASQVTDQDTNDPFDAMLANYAFSFATETPPTVTGTTPINGATTVAANADVTITFSEPVTVTGSWFAIVCTSGTRDTTNTVVSGGPTTFVINPNADFVAGEGCTATIFAAQVADQDTNDPPDTMVANYIFAFGADAAPVVTATTPAVGATSVATAADLTVTFSKPVTVSGDWFAIACPTSGVRNVAATVVSGGPTTFTINPNADFASGETCTVTVAATGVSDQDTNDPPDHLPADYTFSFTADLAPTVTTTVPTDGAGAAASNSITINFSESVTATTSSFAVECPIGTPRTFALSASPATSYTLTPTPALPAGVTCRVTVIAAQISDADAGDPPDTMSANYVFSFTVDTAPAVLSTTPANNATGVAANANIVVTFTESVNATTGSFTIECPAGGGARTFALSASPDSTFTLDPTTDLPGGTVCTVTVIATAITDADTGDPPDTMAANFVFTFGVPPVANPDTYMETIIGNVGVNTANSTNFSILANDNPPVGVTITTSGATTGGGTVLVALDGTFAYTPAPGFEGSDSFTYTITTAAGTSAPATVTINAVVGVIWFINANAATNGDGRISTPFNCLSGPGCFAAVNDGVGGHPADGDRIFLYESATPYVGPLTLLANQRLIGQDAGNPLATLAGLTPPADTIPLPLMNSGGLSTTIGVAGLTLGATNQLHGFILNTTGGTAIVGANFGTLVVSTVTISALGGGALSLTNGTLAGLSTETGFTAVSSTGGANNISLSGVGTTATFAFGGGALSGASAEAFKVTVGNGSFTYAGTITNAATLAVNIANMTGGGVTLSGDINPAGANKGIAVTGNSGGATIVFSGASKKISTETGTGVNLMGNTGATIIFSDGGLAITTTTGIGFNATNGGTVTVQGTGNSVISGSGTAINIANTTIGSAGVTFQSATSIGGTATGIILDGTGVGGFTISGNGSAVGAAGGGVISGKSQTTDGVGTNGTGIYLNNVSNVSLNGLDLHDFQNWALRGLNVNGFNLTNSLIYHSSGKNGTNAALEEGSVFFGAYGGTTGIKGAATISDTTIEDGYEDNLVILARSDTLSLTIANTIVRDTSAAAPGNNGLYLEAGGTGTLNAVITNSTFSRNRANNIQAATTDSGNMDLRIGTNGVNGSGGTFSNGNSSINLDHASTGNFTFNVLRATLSNAAGQAAPLNINMLSGGGGTFSGNIKDNIITNHLAGVGPAVRIVGNSQVGGTLTINVQDNIITNNAPNIGLNVLVRDNVGGPASTVNATLQGNTITNTSNSSSNVIQVNAGAVSNDNVVVNVDIRGNVLGLTAASEGSGNFDIRLARITNGPTARIEGYPNSANDGAAIATYLAGLNTGTNGVSVSATTTGTGWGTIIAVPMPNAP